LELFTKTNHNEGIKSMSKNKPRQKRLKRKKNKEKGLV